MPADPSAAPVRERGLRSRAGNAMGRTRAAVLDGAARAVEKHGARRATMADIAALAGIAKGTLYNHFRAKDAVYAAAVEAGVHALGEECAQVAAEDLAEALALAADRLGSHPALRRVAGEEPATLASLTTVAAGGGWETARTAVRAVLEAAGRDSAPATVDVVLRWLVSFVGSPGSAVEDQAQLVAAAAPIASPGAVTARAAAALDPAAAAAPAPASGVVAMAGVATPAAGSTAAARPAGPTDAHSTREVGTGWAGRA